MHDIKGPDNDHATIVTHQYRCHSNPAHTPLLLYEHSLLKFDIIHIYIFLCTFLQLGSPYSLKGFSHTTRACLSTSKEGKGWSSVITKLIFDKDFFLNQAPVVLLIFTCMCVKLWYLWRTQCEKVVGEDGNTNEDFASIMKGIMEKLTKERKDMKLWSQRSRVSWLWSLIGEYPYEPNEGSNGFRLANVMFCVRLWKTMLPLTHLI
mgnify:CR=1 FL=1